MHKILWGLSLSCILGISHSVSARSSLSVPLSAVKPSRAEFSLSLLRHWEEMLRLLGPEIFLDTPKPAIKMPSGDYVLLGHQHEVFAAHKLGWKTVPIEVIKDFSDLSQQEAETKLLENGWIPSPLLKWESIPTRTVITPELPQNENELKAILRRIRRPAEFRWEDYADHLDEVLYIHNGFMLTGQTTFSELEVRTKIAEEIQAKNIRWDTEEQEWILPHDKGRSTMTKERPALGILVTDGIVAVDGNHKIMANMALGGTRSSVTIYLNLAQYGISSKDLTSELVYLWKADGSKLLVLPRTFAELSNDPNRFFAARIIGKVFIAGPLDDLEIIDTKGPSNAIVLKFNRDINFLELHVARVLHEYGFHFPGTSEADITPEMISTAQKILLQAQKDGDPIMQFVVVLSPEQKFRSLSEGHLRQMAVKKFGKCGQLLRRDTYF